MEASEEKSQRLFFALFPTEGERENLRQQVRQVLPKNIGIRLSTVGNLHCTLAFLGECNYETQQCYIQAATTIAAEPFVLTLDRMQFRRKQSMLWASTSGIPEALSKLNHDLQQMIMQCGFVADKRKFMPHVTIARKIDKAPKMSPWQPVLWQIDRLVLMRSQIDHNGASYTVVQSWPFHRDT